MCVCVCVCVCGGGCDGCDSDDSGYDDTAEQSCLGAVHGYLTKSVL